MNQALSFELWIVQIGQVEKKLRANIHWIFGIFMLFFEKISPLKPLIFPVLIDVWCSFWSKNTQWIKLFHLSYGSFKLDKLKKNYEQTFADFWYFYDIHWKNFSTQTSISPVLIDMRCSFWSKNTQLIKLFHLSYKSFKLVKLKKSYERTFDH